MRGKYVPLILLFIATVARAQSSRHFTLVRTGTIDGLENAKSVRIWLPIPPQTAEQKAVDIGRSIPGILLDNTAAPDGNTYRSFDATADNSGSIRFQDRWDITRSGAKIEPEPRPNLAASLMANALIPINGKPMVLLAGKKLSDDPMTLGRQLFDLVEQTMTYRKDQPGWGRGDAVWACDSHFGNCTDFSSLFISLARSKNLPAVYQMGYAIPTDKTSGTLTGYHCWTWFYVTDKGWVPIDLSQTKQTGVDQFGWLNRDRVLMTIGRDLTLSPPQARPPLNYLVDPYAESDGKPISQRQIHLRVAFEDMK